MGELSNVQPLGLDTAHFMERVSVFTPLGLRFWDEALKNPVTRGLTLMAYPLDQPNAPVAATCSPSGIYVLQGLPGLGMLERPPISGGSTIPDGSVRFAITVEDTLGRFSPILFGLALPLTYRGIFGEADPSQKDAKLYLFSSATRAVATGIAAIRAELWDVDAGKPAAYAFLSASLQGVVKHAIADAQGRCLIEIPWPTVERLRLGSPPGFEQGAPIQQEWPISIEVQYQPGGLAYLLAANENAGQSWQQRPSLRSVSQQSWAMIWPSSAGAPVTSWNTNLTFGSELVLRTAGSSKGQVLISKGNSLP